MKFLVVDDNAEVRRLIKSLLNEISDEVYECVDGAEAVEIYRNIRPKWVLMDVFMKKMDGFAAMTEIKKLDPRARVVIVSNHTDKRTQQTASELGAYAFFGKDDLVGLLTLLKMKQLDS